MPFTHSSLSPLTTLLLAKPSLPMFWFGAHLRAAVALDIAVILFPLFPIVKLLYFDYDCVGVWPCVHDVWANHINAVGPTLYVYTLDYCLCLLCFPSCFDSDSFCLYASQILHVKCLVCASRAGESSIVASNPSRRDLTPATADLTNQFRFFDQFYLPLCHFLT